MFRDSNGSVIPYGRSIRTLEESFLYGSNLPSWINLTGTNATFTIIPPDQSNGGLQLNTDSIANYTAHLKLLPSGIVMNKMVGNSNMKEIIVSLDNLELSSTNIDFFLHIKGTDTGVSLRTTAMDTVFLGHSATGQTQIPVNYYIKGDGEYRRRKNLSFRLRSDGTVVFQEGDNVIAEYNFGNNVDLNDVLFPEIILQTKHDVSEWLRVSKITLSILHN